MLCYAITPFSLEVFDNGVKIITCTTIPGYVVLTIFRAEV